MFRENKKIFSDKQINLNILYSESIISCLLDITSFVVKGESIERRFRSNQLNMGIDLELQSILRVLPKELLFFYQKSFEFDYRLLYSLHTENKETKSLKGLITGPAEYFIFNDYSLFDVFGINVLKNKKTGEVIILFNTAKRTIENGKNYEESLIGLDSFRAIYEGLLKVLNNPNEFPPDKTTIFIAQNGPILQERGLEKISGFSDINLNDLLRRGKMGDKVEGEDRKWTKLSKSDVAKHVSVKMIQKILFNEKGYDSSINDKHAFEKFYKDNVKGQISPEFISKIKVIISRDYGISMKELSKLDNFIFNVLDNNIKSYYGTYLDDSGNVKFGLVLDGSIQSFLPSKESFLLSDIPNDIIDRSNLEEGLDYKEGKLIGCFVLGFKFENREPIYRLFKVDRSINLENGWQLGYINPDTNEVYQIFITDANSRKLYGRFVFENKAIKDYGKDRINNMIDWWRNEELNNLIRGNYLTEGDRRYGIKLVSSIITRYGNTYQITTIKVNPISPHLLLGTNYTHYETM